MSLKPFGGTATLNGAVQSLTVLLQQIDATFKDGPFGYLTIRAATGNAATVYFGTTTLTNPPVLTAHGYLDAREAAGFPLFGLQLHTDAVYFAGQNGDKVYLSMVEI